MTTEEINEIIAEYDAGNKLCDIGKKHNINTSKIIYLKNLYLHINQYIKQNNTNRVGVMTLLKIFEA